MLEKYKRAIDYATFGFGAVLSVGPPKRKQGDFTALLHISQADLASRLQFCDLGSLLCFSFGYRFCLSSGGRTGIRKLRKDNFGLVSWVL